MTLRTRLARLERVARSAQAERCPKCGRAALGPPAPPDEVPSPEELGAMPLEDCYAAYREMLNGPLPGSRVCSHCGHTVEPPPSPDGPTEAELRAMSNLELLNLHRRLVLGRPPVTEAWFAELSGWFQAHEGEVRRLATNGNFIAVGGRWTSADGIRDRLAAGIGETGVGELLDEVEELKPMAGGYE